jgi:hypothetical protein
LQLEENQLNILNYKTQKKTELDTAIISRGTLDIRLWPSVIESFTNKLIKFHDFKYFSYKTGSTNKLPQFILEFVLFVAAVAKTTAALFFSFLRLINVILEVAPRGIFSLLSMINLIFSFLSLSSTEWFMKVSNRVNDEVEESNHFCSSDLPSFPLYVQHDLTLYES